MVAVICLGEVLIDQVVDPVGNRQDLPGGAPANVAVALSRLGVATGFVGAVGRDAQGQSLVTLLTQLGVDCQGVQWLDRPTRIVEVRCTATGDRAFGGFQGASTTAFADAHLDAQQLPVAQLQGAQAVVMGTLGLAYPATQAAMAQAASLVKSHGGQVVIDLNWRPTFWPDPSAAPAILLPWLAQADWLKLSADEALALFGTATVADLRVYFPQAQGLIVTDGERGCAYAIADHQGQVPAFTVVPEETTGAGDAFLAGLIYGLQQQAWQVGDRPTVERILTLASAMGALTTLKAGAIAAQPTPADLQSFLQAHTPETWTI